MSADDVDERVYLMTWEDENGDGWIFSTSDITRADAKLREMAERGVSVRINFNWHENQH